MDPVLPEPAVNNTQTVKLTDERTMTIAAAVYPIPIPDQITLIQLWRTEWDKTELDWLAAMNGDYSRTLAIHSVIGTIDGQAAGTADVYHAVEEPEVALVGSVLTHPDFRSLGIATHLTNGVVDPQISGHVRMVPGWLSLAAAMLLPLFAIRPLVRRIGG